MLFNPKEALESVRVLSLGDKIHHTLPTFMWMRLPKGELATTDAKMPLYLDHTFTVSLTSTDQLIDLC